MAKPEISAGGKSSDYTKQLSSVLTPPKPDKDRAPIKSDLGRRDRQSSRSSINDHAEGVDKVYGISSRARWGGSESIHELSQDSQKIEQLIEGKKE